MNNLDVLVNLFALTYFKQEFDLEDRLSEEISETDWEILQTWEDCQEVSYEDILDTLLVNVKAKIKELKGI